MASKYSKFIHLRKEKPGVKARLAAFDIIKAVEAGKYADLALDEVHRKYAFGSLDSSLVTDLAYGVIRRKYLLDCWLNYLGKIPAKKQHPYLRLLIHLGLYQILFMDKIPSSAAVNTTVELIKSSKLKNLSSVVNAILRECIRAKQKGFKLPLPSNDEEILAQNESLPVWIARKLIIWRGVKGAEEIAQAYNSVPPLDIRVNRLITTIDDLRLKFNKAGISCKPIKSCQFGLEIDHMGVSINNLPGYKEGEWCVQDRAAQLVSPLLRPEVGSRILDACAAPGGKTTHIGELIDNQGEIWAVDRSVKRLKKVQENVERLGIKCIKTIAMDASSIIDNKKEWKNYFKYILIDAPCSGLGTLARNPDARWRISSLMIDEMIILQRKLLESISPLLSPGGRIVYSTCTINPDENSRLIDKFIGSNQELILKEESQLWPNINKSGDGFYVAIMEHTG